MNHTASIFKAAGERSSILTNVVTLSNILCDIKLHKTIFTFTTIKTLNFNIPGNVKPLQNIKEFHDHDACL